MNLDLSVFIIPTMFIYAWRKSLDWNVTVKTDNVNVCTDAQTHARILR